MEGYKELNTLWDRNSRNETNRMFSELYGGYLDGTIDDFKNIMDNTLDNFLESSLSMIVKDDYNFGVNYVLGTLNVNTGELMNADNRIRGILTLPNYNRLILSTRGGAKLRLFFYEGTSADTFIGCTDYSTVFALTGEFEDKPYYRVRILLAYNDDKDVMDIDELANKFVISEVLEPSLGGKRLTMDVFKTLYGNVGRLNTSFSIGIINSPNGAELSSDAAIRSSYISTTPNSALSVVDSEMYEMNIYYYDGTSFDTYKGMTGWITHDNINTDYSYYKVVVRYKDNRNVTVEELSDKIEYRTSGTSLLSPYRLTGSDWSIGSLVPSSTPQPEYEGDLITSYNRMRSKYLKVTVGSIIKTNKDELKYRYLFYDEPAREGYKGVNIDYTKTETVIPRDGYIKLLVAFDDDRDITDMTDLYPYIEILTDPANVIDYEYADKIFGFTNIPNNVFKTDPLPIVNNTNEGLYVRGMTHEDVYNLYDELQDEHPDKVFKTYLGSSNDKPIYQYEIKSPKPMEVASMNSTSAPIVEGSLRRAKVVITSTIHGTEKMATWNVYNMFDHILNKWQDDENLRFLHQNVHFVVIPVVNPDGMDRTTRYNPDGVDLNRNYPVGFYSGGSYRGEAPLSEIENKIVRDVLKEHSDADLVLDYHNTALVNPIPGGAGDKNMIQVCTDNEMIKNVGANVIQNLTPHWRNKYDYLNQAFIDYWTEEEKLYPVGIIVQNIEGSMVQYADELGFKSAIIEQQSLNMFDGNTRYDSFTNEIGFEFCVNMMANLIKNL